MSIYLSISIYIYIYIYFFVYLFIYIYIFIFMYDWLGKANFFGPEKVEEERKMGSSPSAAMSLSASNVRISFGLPRGSWRLTQALRRLARKRTVA